jgi:hypothetical protein
MPVIALRPQPAASDDRYRRRLGEAAWFHLPAPVRRRFSRRLADAEQIVYRGEVVVMQLSRAGWAIAQLARLAGAPLPFTRDALGPCVVVVTECEAMGGQIWSRSYPRPGRFPQVINSAKRFGGPTGLEEYLGLGLVMRLTLEEEAGALVFRSAGYALSIAGITLALPRWLEPGRCTVIHRNETDSRFSFTLCLDHPLLGRLVHQVAFFEEG